LMDGMNGPADAFAATFVLLSHRSLATPSTTTESLNPVTDEAEESPPVCSNKCVCSATSGAPFSLLCSLSAGPRSLKIFALASILARIMGFLGLRPRVRMRTAIIHSHPSSSVIAAFQIRPPLMHSTPGSLLRPRPSVLSFLPSPTGTLHPHLC
jgi:hypothetical protein